MEFIENIQTFFQHIYTDVSSYIGNAIQSPGATSAIMLVLGIGVLLLIIHEKT